MGIGRSFLIAAALSTGVAIPLYVGAQVALDAKAESELKERVDRSIEQLQSETRILREAGETALAKESKDALPHLRERAEKAKTAGEVDLELRLRGVIQKIEEREGVAKKVEPSKQSERPNGSTWRVQSIPGGVKSSTWIENGKVTSVSQDASGKITLAITEPGKDEVKEVFDDLKSFEEKHPEVAKRFTGSGNSWRVMPSPFGEREIPDLFRGFRLPQIPNMPGQVQPAPDLGPVERSLEALKKRQAELRESLNDPVEAKRRLDEVDRETTRLEDELKRLKDGGIARGGGADLNDPLGAFRKMLEDLQKGQDGDTPSPFGGDDPFEQLRKMMEDLQSPPDGDSPSPFGEDALERLRKLMERGSPFPGPGTPKREGGTPGAENGPWKAPEPEKLPEAPAEKPLPEKPAKAGDDF